MIKYGPNGVFYSTDQNIGTIQNQKFKSKKLPLALKELLRNIFVILKYNIKTI